MKVDFRACVLHLQLQTHDQLAAVWELGGLCPLERDPRWGRGGAQDLGSSPTFGPH